MKRDNDLLISPENKAFLALFPIFGSVFDQEQFARDRPELIKNLMYFDWDRDFGSGAFASFEEGVRELKAFHENDYLAKGERRLPNGGTQ